MTREEVEQVKRRNEPIPPCPICHSYHRAGRVSTLGKQQTFYCRTCEVEYDTRQGDITGVFNLLENGIRFPLTLKQLEG